MQLAANRLLTLMLALPAGAPTAPAFGAALTPEKPLVLPGAAGRFDFMQVDPQLGRLLAAHKGTKGLTVVDLKSGQVLPEVKVGMAQGVAVDTAGGRYFVGDEDEKKVVVVDAKKLAVAAEIPVTGPVDAVAYDTKSGMIYADQDDGSSVWVVDPKAKKVVTTVAIPGVPESLAYDAVKDRVYQNIKSKNVLVRINPATGKVEATWSTLPATSPHGLAVDEKHGQALVAGGNGKLVGIDLKTGKAFAEAAIVKGVDQIAFDAERRIVYCAGKGAVTAVNVAGTKWKSLGDTATPKGAKTVALDPASHDIWVSYADAGHSYVERLKAAK